MRREFKTCDRCQASLQDNNSNHEIEIGVIQDSEITYKNFIDIDLCNDCYNQLIKWFGKTNPHNGMEFKIL